MEFLPNDGTVEFLVVGLIALLLYGKYLPENGRKIADFLRMLW